MMKRKLLVTSAIGCLALAIFAMAFVFVGRGPELIGEDDENEMYDGALLALQQEKMMTQDLALGRVPRERLIAAIDAAADSKRSGTREHIGPAKRSVSSNLNKAKTDATASTLDSPVASSPAAPNLLSWTERGPNSDSTGPSNGNTRANSGVTSGRIRAGLVDAGDPSGKTVWVGGVDGGLWKTTDITASPATWAPVNDFLSNLAISDIFQVPGDPNTMYFSTGEGYFNGDAVSGNGVFKSIDHGVTWTQLPTTANLTINRITGDAAGNVYIATLGAGVQRSTNAGLTWSVITPTGSSSRIADMELGANGRLHVTTGLGTSSIGVYRYTDNPATVSSATWTTATTPFPYPSGSNCRVELGISADGLTLYALPSDTAAQVPNIYKSTDGGTTWAAVTAPTATWASQQAWYSLAIGVNPANANELVVGGLDTWKSSNGGTTWTQVSNWVGTAGQYVHADSHKILWYDGGNKLLFMNDGGVFFSADQGTTVRDRNTGLRLKQFYSVAIHPTTTDYFLAGAQDNGTHQLSNAGLSSSVEVTGGDGAYVAIDQDQPQYQFGAYVYDQFRRSTTNGASWSSFNFSSNTGLFINPFEYDSAGNVLYSASGAGTYRRWTNPQTATSVGTSTTAVVTVTGMGGQTSALAMSPTTPGRLFVGTTGGQVMRIDTADTAVSPVTPTNLSTGLPGGYVSSIAFGPTESDIIITMANFGINNVWVTNNGGVTWSGIDGATLPDMPVRWAIFKPGVNNAAIIATEAGVWETPAINGAATVWTADPSFPTVRVDMLRYRASDGLIAAATHGRGIWTTSVSTAANVSISGRVLGSADGRGLTNAQVVLTRPDGSTRQVITGRLGNFQFDDVRTGATYTVSVSSRRFTFTPRTVSVTDSISDLNFYPSVTSTTDR